MLADQRGQRLLVECKAERKRDQELGSVFGVFMVLRELGLHIVHRFKMEDWTGANGTAAVLVCLGLSPAGIVDRVLVQDLSLGF